MKIIVLGVGLQGKAVIHDLESSTLVTEIFAADIFTKENSFAETEDFLAKRGYSKTRAIKLDVVNEKNLAGRFTERGLNAVICMLPIELALTAARAALDAGIPFISSNYTYDLSVLDELAKEKNGIILPEMGLDPGIDLILGRLAKDELDVVYGINSYGGGIPAPECADIAQSSIRYPGFLTGCLMCMFVKLGWSKTENFRLCPVLKFSRKRTSMKLSFPGLELWKHIPMVIPSDTWKYLVWVRSW